MFGEVWEERVGVWGACVGVCRCAYVCEGLPIH